MKKIDILLEGNERIQLEDSDNRPIDSMEKDTVSLLQSDDICTIRTDNTITIIRPSKIMAIVIREKGNDVVYSTTNEDHTRSEYDLLLEQYHIPYQVTS